jgi:hypothetical protein
MSTIPDYESLLIIIETAIASDKSSCQFEGVINQYERYHCQSYILYIDSSVVEYQDYNVKITFHRNTEIIVYTDINNLTICYLSKRGDVTCS